MECAAIQKQLSAYMDGMLEADETQFIDRHLDQCSDCRRELNALRAMADAVRATAVDEAPPDFLNQLHRRMAPGARRRPWLKALFVPLRVKLPLQLVTALAVGVMVFFVSQTVIVNTPSPVPGVDLKMPPTEEQVPAQDESDALERQRRPVAVAQSQPADAPEKEVKAEKPVLGVQPMTALKKDRTPTKTLHEAAESAPLSEPLALIRIQLRPLPVTPKILDAETEAPAATEKSQRRKDKRKVTAATADAGAKKIERRAALGRIDSPRQQVIQLIAELGGRHVTDTGESFAQSSDALIVELPSAAWPVFDQRLRRIGHFDPIPAERLSSQDPLRIEIRFSH